MGRYDLYEISKRLNDQKCQFAFLKQQTNFWITDLATALRGLHRIGCNDRLCCKTLTWTVYCPVQCYTLQNVVIIDYRSGQKCLRYFLLQNLKILTRIRPINKILSTTKFQNWMYVEKKSENYWSRRPNVLQIHSIEVYRSKCGSSFSVNKRVIL